MKKINYTKGYSIIELLVYIALFVSISVVIMQSLLFMMKTYASASSYRVLQQNGELVMENIIRDIRGANNINVGSSVFGASPGTLSLTSKDYAGVDYTTVFSLSGGAVQVVRNSVASNITSNEVTVTSLNFWSITNSKAVKVKVTLTNNKAPSVTSSFYTTVIIRE